MSPFAERLERDLRHIADRATPSSTAWDSIQARIDQQADEPNMEKIIMLAPDDKKYPNRAWIAGGAVAAAVVLLIAGIAFISNDGDQESLVAGEAPEGIALGFVEAVDAWDGAALRALVADDAVIDDESVATADEYLANAEFDRATGWRRLDPRCTATAVGPPAEVTCTYTMQNAWSEALGVGPFTGSSFEFVIEDGLIHEVTHDVNVNVFSVQVWDVFKAWLSDSHPDDVSVMYDFSNGYELALQTPEAVALWEERTNEFIASLADS